MAIDWEGILGAEGVHIQDAYDDAVYRAMEFEDKIYNRGADDFGRDSIFPMDKDFGDADDFGIDDEDEDAPLEDEDAPFEDLDAPLENLDAEHRGSFRDRRIMAEARILRAKHQLIAEFEQIELAYLLGTYMCEFFPSGLPKAAGPAFCR